jgi:hypothetical protein
MLLAIRRASSRVISTLVGSLMLSTNTYGITPIGLSGEAAISPALGNRRMLIY